MSEDPLESMRRMAEADQETRLQNHIRANSQAQHRSRAVRRALRYGTFGSFGLSILLLCLAGQSSFFIGTGLLLLFLSMVQGVVLFFMGGIAGWRTRSLLSDREKQLLDD